MYKLFTIILVCLMFSAIQMKAQINLNKLKNKVQEKVSEKTIEDNSETNQNSNTTTNQNNSTSQTSSSSSNKKNESKKDPFTPVKDNGMTDEIHANHLKQVVFSKTSIEFKKGKEAQLSNTFNLGDEIYVMAYFERSYVNQWLKDKIEMPSNIISYQNIWFEVNGQVVGQEGDNSFEKKFYGPYPYEISQWTNFCYPLHSLSLCENFNRDNIQLPFHSYVIPLLKPGENKVKMFFSFQTNEDLKESGSYPPNPKKDLKLLYQPSEPMAIGEMTIKVNNIADVKKILTKSGFIPVAAQNNPALEKQILTVYNANSSNNKAVKAIIYDGDWSIRREDNIIVGRYVGVKVVSTTDDPNYYKIWDMSAEQPYQGGGKYSTKIILSNYTTPCYTVSSALFK